MSDAGAALPARDRTLLYATGFVRAVGIGMTGVLLGLYLARLGLGPAGIGAVVGAGLGGGAMATLAVTRVADRVPRRIWLAVLTVLGVAGGLVVALASSPVVLALAAALGMVNGMGRDRGAALVVEQAALPATTDDAHRTLAFAWHGTLQDAGHALGGLAAILPSVLSPVTGVSDLVAMRLAMGVPVLLGLVTLGGYAALSPAVERGRSTEPGRRLAPASRRTIGRVAGLFAIDSIAGGFLATAVLAFFLYERFGVDETVLGPLFFVARVANAGSHLLAAWLARRIGLVNTMVFTHIPSSLLLMTIPYAPSFAVAAALFVLREALVEMDVPTRQSYVMAILPPEDHTVASAVTNLVRLAGWAVAPAFAGLAMQGVASAAPLHIGAGMKIAYDLLLYRSFRSVRPPEESAGPMRSTKLSQ